MDLFSLIFEYSFALGIYGALLSLISLVVVIINAFRTSKIIRKYKRLMRGVDNKNLEALLEQYLTSIRSGLTKVDEIDKRQTRLSAQVSRCLQGVGVVRFNPFEDMGSDLSFSVALLNAHLNGVVITGLFGRQSSSTYSKAIANGKSAYPLSAEEMAAIGIARSSLDL